MTFRSAVITFPGSNCDRDMAVALEKISGTAPLRVWHGDADLPAGLDFIALPGGFSYGDYLRSGAMAARSPIMRAVVSAAARGVPVLGVCNGFQVLTEAGLLPGALMRNAGIRFVCREVALRVENTRSLFTSGYETGQILHIPVAHHGFRPLAERHQVPLLDAHRRDCLEHRVIAAARDVDEEVNGSARDIAGVLNETGNVLGMMPHPERAIEAAHGGTDGAALFLSAVKALIRA